MVKIVNSYYFCGSCLYKSNLVFICYDFMLIAIYDLLLVEIFNNIENKNL